MVKKYKWSDDEVLYWARQYLQPRTTLFILENDIAISHSTLWWCFIHRLPGIDYKLFRNVDAKLGKRGRNRPLH